MWAIQFTDLSGLVSPDMHHFQDLNHAHFKKLDLTSQVHPRLRPIPPSEPLYHFLFMINSNKMPSMHHVQDLCHRYFNEHLTFQGHQRSNPVAPFETSYITSYTWLIVTRCLACTISRFAPSTIQWAGFCLSRSSKVIFERHLNLYVWFPIHD